MSRIVLCRHAETAFNARDAFLSVTDLPLSERGCEQALALHGSLVHHHFARAYCSPMERCIQTLQLALPEVPPTVVDELREVHFGSWEGKTLAEVRELDPQGLAARRGDPVTFRPQGGESFADVRIRLSAFAKRLLSEKEPVLIVGHRGSLAVLERLLRNYDAGDPRVTPMRPAELREIAR